MIFKILSESNHKILISILIILAAGIEFLGLSLIYPLISTILDFNDDNHILMNYVKRIIKFFNAPFSENYLIVYLIIIMALKGLILILYKYFVTKSVLTYMINIREIIYNAIFTSNFGFISDKISRLINSMTVQSSTAAGSLDLLFRLIQSSLIMIGLIILGFILSWKMFLFAIFFSVLTFILLSKTLKYSKLLGERLANINEDIYKNITQSLKNYRYLKSINLQNIFYDDIKPIFSNLIKTQIRFVLVNRGTQIITEPIVVTLILLTLFIGINFLNEDRTSLLLIYVVLGRLFTVLFTIIKDLQSFNKDSASVRYCYDIISEMKKNEEIDGNKVFPGLDKSIEIKSTTFQYDNKVLFKNLNLKFYKNKINVIFGESGSGKTTILNIVLGLLKPNQGLIKFDETNLSEYNLKSFRQSIGLVVQDSVIFNSTLRNNLTVRNRKVNDDTLIKYMKKLKLDSMFENKEIDLDYKIDEHSSNLSGGEKQRIALIREIVSQPQILILDEVTSALDSGTTEKVINLIKEIKSNMTLIIVTHQKEYLLAADYINEIKDSSSNIIKS
jgi:ABC-type bacteriocin/lantibiotic exporter with double-glycine peptidase domain